MGRSRQYLQPAPGWLRQGAYLTNGAGLASWLVLLALSVCTGWQPARAATLTLHEAERIALGRDPAVAAGEARSRAMQEDATAEGQLPDPMLRLGLANLPSESLDIEQEPMTQLRFGVSQAFPRGRTLSFKQRRSEWQASAEQAKADNTARMTVRSVRENFLELYYQTQAGRIIDQSRSVFSQLVDITEAHYASGRVSQQDVLRAELELLRLEDRATRIRMAEDASRATLAKWISDEARRPLAEAFPMLPDLPAQGALASTLGDHPAISVESARTQAADESVRIAEEQYKPGFNIGVDYSKRFGENPNGSEREDMLSAMVTMDMPLFTGQRQDRRLAASRHQAESARLERDDRMRELREVLEREYANWQRLGERQVLYEQRLLRDAQANAEASLKAYQSGVTEFNTLMRARITELEVRLDSLRIRIDRAKVAARLLYLASGEEQ